MAPALVHFLAGATLVLLVAGPLALRGSLTRRHLWLVALGGLWGMVPDGHYVTPVFQEQLTALHDSRWADLFVFHYTLDQPPVATRAVSSIAVSVVLFLVAVGVFTAATAVGERRGRGDGSVHGRDRGSALGRGDGPPRGHSIGSSRGRLLARALVVGYAVAIVSVLSTAVIGLLFTETGHIETLAALWGRESALAGWLLLFGCTLGASGVFGLGLELVSRRWRVMGSGPGAGLGVAFGVSVWASVVAVGIPIWVRVAFDLWRPIPSLHWLSLGALVVFGFVVGSGYPLVRRFVLGSVDRTGGY